MPDNMFPIPEFEDEEEKRQYISYLMSFKQEFINNIVVMLFLNKIIETSGGSQDFVTQVIDALSNNFESQMAKNLMDLESEPPSNDGVLRDPDVQRLLGGIIGNGNRITSDDIEDETQRLALKNVCKVYNFTLKNTASDMLKSAKQILGEKFDKYGNA